VPSQPLIHKAEYNVFFGSLLLHQAWNSVVSIETHYRIDGPGFEAGGGKGFFVLQIPSRPDNVPVGLPTLKEYRGNVVHRITTELILDCGFWILIPCNVLGDYQRSNEHSASIFRIISQTLPVNLALCLHLRACPLPGLVHSSHRILRGLQQFT